MTGAGKSAAFGKGAPPPVETQGSHPQRKNKDLWLGIALFAVVVWAFLPATKNDFVGYDDPLYVTGNSHVQQGLTWEGLRWAFSSGEAANWHPITWLSHMLDCQIFGLKPWGHHLTSVILHAISTVLVFVVFRRLTGAVWRSLLLAAFFGLHPLRVESVAWVAERKDVLGAMFWMLTLLAYTEYVESKVQSLKSKVGDAKSTSKVLLPKSKKVASGEWRAAWSQPIPHPISSIQHPIVRSTLDAYYALTLIFFTLGLMSKPMLVTLPFVLLLLDYWPLGRWRVASGEWRGSDASNEIHAPDPGAGRLLLEKIPFFLLAAGASVVTFFVQRSGGALVEGARLSQRMANALVAYCRYLGKLFLPVDLAAFYPPVAKWAVGVVVAAAVMLAGFCILAVVLRRKKPWFFVGWFWFLGTLVPVIGLVPAGEQSMADRYSYVPSIGVLMVLVWGGIDLMRRWLCPEPREGLRAAPHRTRLIFGAGVATLAFCCAALTRNQIGCWKDTETLFRHAIRVTGGNYLAHNNVGTALDKRGLFAEAATEFQLALSDKPDYAEAHNNLGVVLGEQARPEDAIREYKTALKLKPGYADPYNNIGTILEQSGRVEEAIGEYQAALRIRPDYPDAHNNLGAALGRSGRFDEAIREFQAVLKLQPGSADAHNNLGVALDAKGRLDDAIREFEEAIRLMPDFARAHFNLGGALSRKGQLDAAIGQYQEAIRLKPDYAAARTNLSIVLEMRAVKPGNR